MGCEQVHVQATARSCSILAGGCFANEVAQSTPHQVPVPCVVLGNASVHHHTGALCRALQYRFASEWRRVLTPPVQQP